MIMSQNPLDPIQMAVFDAELWLELFYNDEEAL